MTTLIDDRKPPATAAPSPPPSAAWPSSTPPASRPPAPVRRPRRWGRYVLAGGLVLAAALLVRAWIPDPIEVEIATAVRGPLVVVVREDGRTRVKDRFTVSAPATGTLLRVAFEPGDTVRPGTVLARIMPLAAPLLDARTRAETEARLAAAEATVAQARTAATETSARLELATRDAERVRTLLRAGAASAQSAEQADLAARTRAEEAASARFGVQVAEHQAGMYRVALAELARGAGGRVEIRAPVAGVVLGVERQSEGPIQAGQPILTLGDPAALEAVVDLLSADAARVRPGHPAIIEGWGGDRPLQARVHRVEPSAFTRLSALGVEEQRVNVVLDLDEPAASRPSLGDGFRIEAAIEVWRAADALTVPTSALFRSEGRWAVFRVEGGRARLRSVVVGQRTEAAAEITEGIAPNDTVIVYPGEKVRESVRIAIRRPD